MRKKETVNGLNGLEKTCATCKSSFKPVKHLNAKWCSDKCRMRFYNRLYKSGKVMVDLLIDFRDRINTVLYELYNSDNIEKEGESEGASQ